ncbi:MAG: endonuclease [Campylobacterota bacterium]|nr:endonuclease [Campylobacterota bacterium]
MRLISLLFIYILSTNLYAKSGNTKFKDFNNATKQLMNKVYNKIENRTIYCQAEFENKKIININKYTNNRDISRKRLEWEHIVPAQNFGKNFIEWKYGDKKCIEKGIYGRDCLQITNERYQYMQSDLYNIYPSIGFINAKRSNFDFKDGDTRINEVISFANNLFNDKEYEFGKCSIIINKQDKNVIPPNYTKGIIARTYLYMDSTYKKYRLTNKQRKLFEKWNKAYGVTQKECHRAKLISKLQGNHNKLVKELCKKAKLYK